MTIFCSSSCITHTANQTGRTLDIGNAEATLNVDYSGETKGGKIFGPVPIISTSVGVKFGVFEDLDFGCKVDFIGQVSGSLKYQFLGNKESLFASSIGFNLGHIPGELNGINNFYSYRFHLFNSFHSNNNNLAFFISPMYMFLQYSELKSPTNYIRTPGYSTGIVFGDRIKLSLGYTQYFTNEDVFLIGETFTGYRYSYSFGVSYVFKHTSLIRTILVPILF